MVRSERLLSEAPVVPLKGAAFANPERFNLSLPEETGREVVCGGGPGGGPGRVVGGGTALGTADGTAPRVEVGENGSRHSGRVASAGTSRGPRGVAGLGLGSVSISIASGLFILGCVARGVGVAPAGAGILSFGTSDSSVSSATAAVAADFLPFLRSISTMEVRRLGTVPLEGDVLPSLDCGNAHFGSVNSFCHSSDENLTDPRRSWFGWGTASFFGGEPGGGGGKSKGVVVAPFVFGRGALDAFVVEALEFIVGVLNEFAAAPCVFGPGVPFFERESNLISLGSNGLRSTPEEEGRGDQWLEDGAGDCSVRVDA